MANLFSRTCSVLSAIALFSTLLSSCYNKISDELIESDIPIQFTTNIKPPITRVSNNHFEVKDQIGFYLIPEGLSIQEAFISNLKFEFKEGRDFVSSTTAYYPKSDNPSCVFCYYPYQKDPLDGVKGKLKVVIPANQSTQKNIDSSDLLVVKKENVFANPSPQQLEFKHQLTKIELSIKPEKGYSCEEILSTQPKLSVHGLPLTAYLDPKTLTFDQYGESMLIQPLINWRVENEYIKGCTFLAIPTQSLKGVSIDIASEGIIYTCSFPEGTQLESGTINKLVINYSPSKGIEVSNSESVIEEWRPGQELEITPTKQGQAVIPSQLQFDKTNVVHLVNPDGVVKAEVCKELLKKDNVQTQAIVVYPVLPDGRTSLRGLCVKTLDEKYYFDGCYINWDANQNTFEIEKREMNYKNFFFVTSLGEIIFDKSEDSELLHAESYFLKHQGLDYPVAKIGVQFWLTQDLKAKNLVDGTKLAYERDKVLVNIGYTTALDRLSDYMYNRAAIDTNKIIPKGWSCASESNWRDLFKYIQEDYPLLKNADWTHVPGNNETLLDLHRTGCFFNGELHGLSNAYWIRNVGKNDKAFFINDDLKKPFEFKDVVDNNIMANIRCVRMDN